MHRARFASTAVPLRRGGLGFQAVGEWVVVEPGQLGEEALLSLLSDPRVLVEVEGPLADAPVWVALPADQRAEAVRFLEEQQLALSEAADDGRADDLIAYLRRTGRLPPAPQSDNPAAAGASSEASAAGGAPPAPQDAAMEGQNAPGGTGEAPPGKDKEKPQGGGGSGGRRGGGRGGRAPQTK